MLVWPRAIFFPASIAAAQPNKLKEIQLSIFSFAQYAIQPCQDTIICVQRARQILLTIGYRWTWEEFSDTLGLLNTHTLSVMSKQGYSYCTFQSVWKVSFRWPYEELCIIVHSATSFEMLIRSINHIRKDSDKNHELFNNPMNRFKRSNGYLFSYNAHFFKNL